MLALLGAVTYRQLPLQRLGKRLPFAGALIEVAQSMPALHRGCDILEPVTDTIAIIVTLSRLYLGAALDRSAMFSAAWERLS